VVIRDEHNLNVIRVHAVSTKSSQTLYVFYLYKINI